MYELTTPATEPILWPFIVLILIVFLYWTESGSQDLKNPKAHHHSPKILATDLSDDIIAKTKIAVRNSSEIVGWRRAMMVSLVLTLIVLFLFLPVFPTGFTIFLVALLFFVPIYFISIWFSSQYLKPVSWKLEQNLEEINRLE